MSFESDVNAELRKIANCLGGFAERLNGIDDRLEAGSRRHTEFSHSLAEIDRKQDDLVQRVTVVETEVKRLPGIEEKVEKLDDLRIEKQTEANVKAEAMGKIVKVLKSGPAIGGYVGAGLTWVGHYLSQMPWPK